VLFHSTVISAAERESAYVIDGLSTKKACSTDCASITTRLPRTRWNRRYSGTAASSSGTSRGRRCSSNSMKASYFSAGSDLDSVRTSLTATNIRRHSTNAQG